MEPGKILKGQKKLRKILEVEEKLCQDRKKIWQLEKNFKKIKKKNFQKNFHLKKPQKNCKARKNSENKIKKNF